MPKSLSGLKHEESKPNSEVQVRSQKESEADNRRNVVTIEVLQGCENFATCRISQVANHNLRNFAGCEFLQPVSYLTPVLPLFLSFSQTTLYILLVVD